MLLFAPQVDAILENKEFLRNLITSEIRQKMEDIYSVMTGIKTCGGDDQRTIWIEVSRGTIRNFGSYREYLTPRYCHSFFPKEDRIIDLMNLFREDEEKVIKVAFWYPVERVEPV
ncbi:MAG: hypothetical protein JXA23_03435 [Bacteroidales bacterium]|nr:hypothetical protein [Bacteroidales bacterium]